MWVREAGKTERERKSPEAFETLAKLPEGQGRQSPLPRRGLNVPGAQAAHTSDALLTPSEAYTSEALLTPSEASRASNRHHPALQAHAALAAAAWALCGQSRQDPSVPAGLK